VWEIVHQPAIEHGYPAAVLRGLTLILMLVCLAACAEPAPEAASGNVAATTMAEQPENPRWYDGQLVVEPAGQGRACLTLVTPTETYVLRAATSTLTPVAWEENGAFDASRSGIARGDRLVAPYAADGTSVRGGVTAEPDPECPSHATLAFTKVRSGAAPEPESTAPSPTGPTASGAPTEAVAPGLVEVWKAGRLTVVPGNQGEGECLALETAVGAYVLGSSTTRLDASVTVVNGVVDQRRTGIHIHGRNSLGMARTYGQRVELLGTVSPGTDVNCSDYPTFGFVDLR